nr:hypothetical protein [Providencia rettgeri]
SFSKRREKSRQAYREKGSVSQAVLSLLHHAYKDKPLSDEMWKEIEDKFTHMLDELSAAWQGRSLDRLLVF